MYAVIFNAEVAELDEGYLRMAARLRELALAEYGCIEFVSSFDGSREIAISYWQDEGSIVQWKNNAEHLIAQAFGKSTWYRCYRIDIVEIKRTYRSQPTPK